MALSSQTNRQLAAGLADPGAAIELANAVLGVKANGTQNVATQVTFSNVGGAANVALVNMTFKDTNGIAITYPLGFTWWLSDAASGAGLTATTASGAVAAGANGTDQVALVTKKSTWSQCSATGLYQASITDTAKTAFVLVVQLDNGTLWLAPALIYT